MGILPSLDRKSPPEPGATVTTDTGALGKRSTYRPFGEITNANASAPDPHETKGFIGTRFDEDSGRQYLNARYFDPEGGRFIQPDWFEVTNAGVGTNRYAYAGTDPANLSDPGDAVETPRDVFNALLGAVSFSLNLTAGMDPDNPAMP